MIQATELRLNNYVKYNGIIMSVTAIDSPKPRKEKIFDGKYLIELFDGTGFITATTDQVDSTPLTEEILLKCGFELVPPANPEFHLWSDYIKDGICITLPYFEMVFDNGDKAIEVKYLHQLQNIVHALTNTELKINLHSK